MSRPRLVRATATVVAALIASQLLSLPANADFLPAVPHRTLESEALTSPTLVLESNAGHVVNSTLTIQPGDWSPLPADLAYSWTRDGRIIDGAASASYTLTDEDLHRFIQGFATGRDESGTLLARATEQIGPIRPAQMLTHRGPVITGIPQVGSTLAEVGPEWGPAPVTRAHQWLRNGAEIPGATESTYIPVEADIGANISVRVTGSKPGYVTAVQQSSSTGQVQPEGFSVTVPTILGTAKVDQTLTVVPGIWSPAPETFTYQWNRNGVPIAGATAEKFTTTAADYMKYLTVTVTATKEGLPPTSLTSAHTGIHRGEFISPVPTIAGAPRAGSTLSAITGDWTPGATLSIQWQRNGADITGAISADYTLQRVDIGAAISVRVTATKAAYFPYSTSSKPTPFITGTLKEFSGDGHSDVLARDSAGRLWLYAGNPLGGWKPRKQVGSGWNVLTSIVAPGDFNGDGFADVLGRDVKGGLHVYPGNGAGGWEPPAAVGSGWNAMTSIIAPGDFDGDGNADVLARDRQGALYLYPSDGWHWWLPRVQVGTGWNAMTAILGPGDFSGDGNVDILARDASGYLWLYPGNGAGGWKTRVKAGSGWNGFTSILVPGDFDGDGHVDVMARSSDGALWLYPGNGAGGWKARSKVGSGWNIFSTIL
ncbi:FG-GAP-like repeat-containing protein [Arthrobacter sp. EH-1B-1]|uniref:FG-GAP-like repeat-containing protein n=1 Tax=Arthrobacter vasquezii TaxID=2977629 RepID=A0ABT6CS79_9MICC|nr:FG-GAP-like repeat-containing protein [Arthrobacter vasquezii]MDF9276908.1 FG-GAP-like repeat-containing protein [Arthrobacter vasquezii]